MSKRRRHDVAGLILWACIAWLGREGASAQSPKDVESRWLATPNRGRVAFISGPMLGAKPAVCVLELPTCSLTIALEPAEQERLSEFGIQWFRDGESILFGRDGPSPALYRLDLGSARSTVVSEWKSQPAEYIRVEGPTQGGVRHTTMVHAPSLEFDDKYFQCVGASRRIYSLRSVLRHGPWPEDFHNMAALKRGIAAIDHGIDSLHTEKEDAVLVLVIDSLGRDSVLFRHKWWHHRGFAVSPDETKFAFSDGGGMEIWDRATGRTMVPTWLKGYRLFAPQFSRSGHALAAIGWSGKYTVPGAGVFVSRGPDFHEFRKLCHIPTRNPFGLTWSPDDEWILVSVDRPGSRLGVRDLIAVEVATGEYVDIPSPYLIKGRPAPDVYVDGPMDWSP